MAGKIEFEPDAGAAGPQEFDRLQVEQVPNPLGGRIGILRPHLKG